MKKNLIGSLAALAAGAVGGFIVRKIANMQLSETNKREEKLEETITFRLGDRMVAGYLSGGWLEKDIVKMMNDGLSEEDTIGVFRGELIGSPYNYYIMDLNTSKKIIELLKQKCSEM